jgi:hypothetical protein
MCFHERAPKGSTARFLETVTLGFLRTTAQKENYRQRRNGNAHRPEKNVTNRAFFLLSSEELHWSFITPPADVDASGRPSGSHNSEPGLRAWLLATELGRVRSTNRRSRYYRLFALRVAWSSRILILQRRADGVEHVDDVRDIAACDINRRAVLRSGVSLQFDRKSP